MPSRADSGAPKRHVYSCGDDLVAAECADTRTAQALADHLRESGEWLECVAGIESCVARFDLAAVSAVLAGAVFGAVYGTACDTTTAAHPPPANRHAKSGERLTRDEGKAVPGRLNVARTPAGTEPAA